MMIPGFWAAAFYTAWREAYRLFWVYMVMLGSRLRYER